MKKTFLIAFLLVTLTLTAIPTSTFAQSTDSTWVYMVGYIEQFGDKSVSGWVGAWAEIDQWAEVHAFWTWPQILPIPGNYAFYYARLVDASIIKLDYNEKDFYILGTWDVLKITLVYDMEGNITKVMEIVADDASGDLSVTGGWSAFTIVITGVDLITGRVLFYRMVSDGPIPIGDVTGLVPDTPDGEINIRDLVHVAKAYGDTPGIGRYNFDIDFNFDFQIDIIDLTTLAASLGETY